MFAFFQNVQSVEELKSAYRRLVLVYHPDRGGNAEDFARLRAEYDQIYKSVGNIHSKKDGTYYKNENESCNPTEDEFKDIIVELLKIDGIKITLVGCWLWIDGETKAVKDRLKDLGCRWSGPRKLWYWHDGSRKFRHASKETFAEICNTYGARSITAARPKSAENQTFYIGATEAKKTVKRPARRRKKVAETGNLFA